MSVLLPHAISCLNSISSHLVTYLKLFLNQFSFLIILYKRRNIMWKLFDLVFILFCFINLWFIQIMKVSITYHLHLKQCPMLNNWGNCLNIDRYLCISRFVWYKWSSNICVQVYKHIPSFAWRICLRIGCLKDTIHKLLAFRKCQVLFQVSAPFYIPAYSKEFLFSHIFVRIWCLFNGIPSSKYVVLLHGDVNFWFSHN